MRLTYSTLLRSLRAVLFAFFFFRLSGDVRDSELLDVSTTFFFSTPPNPVFDHFRRKMSYIRRGSLIGRRRCLDRFPVVET